MAALDQIRNVTQPLLRRRESGNHEVEFGFVEIRSAARK